MTEYRILSATNQKELVALINDALDSPPGAGPKWELHGYVFETAVGLFKGCLNQAMTKEPERVYGGKYHNMLVVDLKGQDQEITDEIYQRELDREDPEFS